MLSSLNHECFVSFWENATWKWSDLKRLRISIDIEGKSVEKSQNLPCLCHTKLRGEFDSWNESWYFSINSQGFTNAREILLINSQFWIFVQPCLCWVLLRNWFFHLLWLFMIWGKIGWWVSDLSENLSKVHKIERTFWNWDRKGTRGSNTPTGIHDLFFRSVDE
jgi:hypothetical protein